MLPHTNPARGPGRQALQLCGREKKPSPTATEGCGCRAPTCYCHAPTCYCRAPTCYCRPPHGPLHCTALQVGPGSFTVMLSSLLTARSVAADAACLGDLLSPEWWADRGWRAPPLPPYSECGGGSQPSVSTGFQACLHAG